MYLNNYYKKKKNNFLLFGQNTHGYVKLKLKSLGNGFQSNCSSSYSFN